MVETHWTTLEDEEVRYGDHTWTLTGAVEVRDRGELLGVEANRVDGVRHETATLYFGIGDAPNSLNPGAIGQHFDELDRTGATPSLVVRTEGRTYRYELQRMEYD